MTVKKKIASARPRLKAAAVLMLCLFLLVGQGWKITAQAEDSGVPFAGFNSQNMNLTASNWSTLDGAAVGGGQIAMTGADSRAVYYINLASIGASVDCGHLHVDFDVNALIGAEAADQLDTAKAAISFRATEGGADLASDTMDRGTGSPGAAIGLHSGAAVPEGTRFIFVELQGIRAGDTNTTVFTSPSLYIRDTADPTLSSSYNTAWTNQDITVTLTATDSASGIEGIYDSGSNSKVSGTTTYQYTTGNNGTHTFYTLDYAGRRSADVTISITNIDKHAPASAPTITLSKATWSNTPVTFTLSTVTPAAGESPETRQYKLGSGEWTAYSGEVTINDQGQTVVSVRVADEAANTSGTNTKTAYVDTVQPTVDTLSAVVHPAGGATVTFTAGDATSGVAEKRWANGTRDAAFFATGGTTVPGSTFEASAGGDITVYARDNAGNTVTGTLRIDTYPSVDPISSQSVNEDETKDITFNVSDSETAAGSLTVSAESADTSLLPNPVCTNDNGSVTLTLAPAPNKNGGPVTVTVSVTDGGGNTSTRSFSVTVNSVNDVPNSVNDDSVTTNEDTPVTISVLQNDTDADGQTLTVASVGAAAHGTTALMTDHKGIIYTPNANYNGTDSFTYTATDGTATGNAATVSITVTEINDAPHAADDTLTITEDDAPLIDVLDNDTDADKGTTADEALTIQSVGTAAHGLASLEDGQIRYTPVSNWSGSDSFSYTIEDRKGVTSTASVHITVNPYNDPPAFSGVEDIYTVTEDSSADDTENTIHFSITDIETDHASLMLQAASLNESLVPQSGITVSGLGDANADAAITVVPKANAFGSLSLSLKVSDGFKVTEKLFTLNITPVNDAPVANPDEYTYTEDDDSLIIDMDDLTANDTDIDLDTLHFTGIADGPTAGTLTAVDAGEHTYRFTPPADYDDTVTFHYSLYDGTVTVTGQVTLRAESVNDAPVLTLSPANVYTTAEDTTLSGVQFTISDLETGPSGLIVTAGSSDPGIVSAENISVSKGSDGACTLSITPNANAHGTSTITLSLSDGLLLTSKTFLLTVGSVEDTPTAVDDEISVEEGGAVSFQPMLNDYDGDNDIITLVSYASPSHGTVTRSGDTLRYQAAAGYSGMDSFTYTISDGDDTATAAVNVAVGAFAHPPVLTGIANQFLSENGETGDLAFSATDRDAGDELTLSITSSNTGLVPQDADNLVLTDLGAGQYTLKVVPATAASGAADITITAEDLMHNTVSTTFTVTVYAINGAPTAADDDVTVNEDGSVLFDVLENDSDPETAHDDLRVIAMSAPSHGWLSGAGGTYIYHPYGNYNGPDSFAYTMTDGSATDSATVRITINAVNDAPYAYSIDRALPNVTGSETTTVNVLGSAHDVDGDTLYTDSIPTGPRHGTAVINGDGTITYTRTEVSGEGNGADSFTYRVRDREPATGEVRYATATVYIGVYFAPALWTGNIERYVQEDAAPFWIGLDVSNPNGNELTITAGTPSLGTATVDETNKRVLYSPSANANGSDSFTYTVKDETSSQSRTSTIYIYIYPVNDPPTFDSVPADTAIDEDTSTLPLDVAFSDPDAVGDLIFTVSAANADPSRPILEDGGISISRSGNTATLQLTPVHNANGSVPVTLLVSDGLTSATRTFTLTVRPVNDAPTAEDKSITMREDTTTEITVITPNSDVDGDPLTVSIPEGMEPAHGTAIINPDKSITYAPAQDYFGTDSFTYMLDDGNGGTDTGTLSITVQNVNDLPAISGLLYRYETGEDIPLNVPFQLTDADGDTLNITYECSNTTLFPEGSITFDHEDTDWTMHAAPGTNRYGTATVKLHVHDGTGETAQSLVVTVNSINDIPNAADDNYTINEDTSTVFDVLDNDSDVEDATLRIVAVSATTSGGTVVNNSGALTYTPKANHYGTDSFTYTVTDSNDGKATATVSITINPVNDAPLAVNDTASTPEDTAVTLNVLSNDSDAENNTLAIESTGTTALGGTVSVNPNNTITYTPAQNVNGTETFTYTVSDGQTENNTATATVTIVIGSINDAPTVTNNAANPGTWTFDEDTTGTFLFDVSDPETDAKNIIVTTHSSVPTLIKDTSITYTGTGVTKTLAMVPEANANGDCTVTVTASDGVNTTTEVFPVHVNPVNDRPTITAANKTTSEDTPVSGTATGTDVEGSTLIFSQRTSGGDGPHHGSVEVQPGGNWTYTPSANYNGTDTFVILVDDGAGAPNSTNASTVTITVTPVNDPPTAGDDTASTNEDTAVTIHALVNDTDIDRDASLNQNPGAETLTLVSNGFSGVDHGTAAVVDGDIVFTPAANWNGTESFTYTMRDAAGATDTASVTVTVNPEDDPPASGNDSYTTAEDTPKVLDVLANDDIDATTNPADEVLTVTGIVADVQHGTTAIAGDSKSITYTPAANYYGPDGFTYAMQDKDGHTAQFTVTLSVTSVNDIPTISAISAQTTNEDTPTGAIAFTVTDVEDDDALLAVTGTTPDTVLFPNDASHITITNTGDSNRTITLTPATNRNGTATITVSVKDSSNATATTTFNATVSAVNDVPSATNDAAATDENTPITIDVLVNDDVDLPIEGDTLDILSITDTDSTHLGTFSVEDGTGEGHRDRLVFTPDANWTSKTSQIETLEYTMQDASTAQSTARVSITIDPVNDTPTISDIPDADFDEDTPEGTGEVAFSVTDEEDDDDTLSVTASSDNQGLIPDSSITITNPAGGTGSERTLQAVTLPNANGTAIITVTVTDSQGKSSTDTFTITVDPVQDDPTDGDDAFDVTEDTPATLNVLENDDVDAGTNPTLENVTVVSIGIAPSHGTAVKAGDGKSILYTPDADNNEDDTFTYTMQDAASRQATFTVAIHMLPVNDPPDMHSTILDQTTDEGVALGPLSFTVTDVDDDDGILTITATSSNQVLIPVGNVAISNEGGSDRTVSITPSGRWNGSSNITLTVKDDENAFDSGSTTSFKVTVRNINDPPVAANDSYTINEDTPTILNVRSNDTDVDLTTNPTTETMTIVSVSGVDFGTADFSSGTSILYTPPANWNGTEDFTYTIRDTEGATSTASVHVNVSGKNDAPVAVNDTASTNEDTSVLIDAKANDSDVDTDADLNQDPNANPANESIAISALSNVDNGTAVLESGRIRFTPAANWNGTEIFNYTLRDAAGATATGAVTVTVNPINDTPVAVNDTKTMAEDTSTSINVLANDSDTDLSAALNHPVTDSLSVTLDAQPAHGTAAVNPDKTISYTPAADWNGTDSFNYTVHDTGGATAGATVTVTVNNVNDAPAANADSKSTNEDTAVLIDALDNDTDTDKDASLNATPGAESLSLVTNGFSGVDNGTVSIVSGQIQFTPAANWNGSETFTYTVRDVTGATATANVTVAVGGVNDTPVANADTAATNEDTAVTINALTNDTDVDTSITLNHDPAANPADEALTIVEDGFSGVDHGIATAVSGQIRFTPAANWNGIETFTYTITDHLGVTATASVTVTVSAINDAPVANADTPTTPEDTAITFDALFNDTDVDKDPSLNASPGAESLSLVTDGFSGVDHGTAAVISGQIRFTPQANWNGEETFTYTMRDVAGATAISTVTVTVSGVNDPPVAADDTASTGEDTPVSIDALVNDTDIDQDTSLNHHFDPASEHLSIAADGFASVDHGTAVVEDGKIQYTPEENWNGTEIFTYTVLDAYGGSDTGEVTVTVTSTNNAPKANADSAATNEDTAVSIPVIENDTDPDLALEGDDLLVYSTADVDHGSITVAPDKKSLTFTPAANWNGTETFTYTLEDKAGWKSSAQVTVTVSPINDEPTANADSAATEEDTPITLNVLGNDTDPDIGMEGDELTITSVFGVDNAGVNIADNKKSLTFTPDGDWNGTEIFSYTITDSHGETATAQVTVTVDAVNDAPSVPTLLTPTKGSAYKDGQTVQVTWEMSSDVEEDAVTYDLYFYDGTKWAEIAQDLTDTGYDHVLTDTGLSTDKVCYRVEAGDGKDTSADTGDDFIIDNKAPQNVKALLKTGTATIADGTWTNQSVAFSLTGGTDLLPFVYEYRMATDGDWTAVDDGEQMLFTQNGQYTVYYHAVDTLENTWSSTAIIRIDKLAPAMPDIQLSTTEPTNKDVTVTLALKADPGESGNRTVRLPNGSQVNAAETVSWTADKNGKYVFTLSDAAGNILDVPVEITNIDKAAPIIRANSGGYIPGGWISAVIHVDLSYSDTGSGIAWKRYYVGDTAAENGQPSNYRSKLVFGKDGTYYIHASAQDLAGNRTQAVFGPYMVDMTPPEMAYATGAVTTSGGNIDLTIADAASGVVKVTLPDGSVVESPSANFKLPVTKSGDYTIEVRDAAGNTTRRTIRIELPEIETTPAAPNNDKPTEPPAAPSYFTGVSQWIRSIFSPGTSGGLSTGGIWAISIAGAALLMLIILLLLLLRPVRIDYDGTRNGKPWRRTRRRFAHVPRKGGTLHLQTGIKARGIELQSITVTFRRGFTRRMRSRKVELAFYADIPAWGTVPADQTGKWNMTGKV